MAGACAFLFLSCSAFKSATAPAPPLAGDMSAPGPVPDSLMREAIRRGDLIVLDTPVDMVSEHGFLTPRFQMGAKETWLDVKLVVDSVFKGKFRQAGCQRDRRAVSDRDRQQQRLGGRGTAGAG